MKIIRGTGFALAVALGIGVMGCGGGGEGGTFVLVELRQGTLSMPINSIDLSLAFNGMMASRTLAESGGAVILLPTTAVFNIRNGAGRIDVLASAKDAGGALLAQGMAGGDVVRGDTLSLTISFGDVAIDAGVDGGGAAMLVIDKPNNDFGTVVTGMMSAPATFTITNTGTAPSGTLAASVTGTGFVIGANSCNGMTLAPAATCTVAVTFAPTSAGSAMGMLTVTGSPGGSAGAMLTGTGVAPGALAISPSTQDFGMVTQGGNSATTAFTVTNSGGTLTSALAVSLGGADMTQFQVTADGCNGQTLAGSATCQITARFSPTSPGAKTASLTVTATMGGTTVASITGTGLAPGALTITPTEHDFGSVLQGTPSATIDFLVTNTGGSASGTLTTSLSGPNAADFMMTANTCMNNTLAASATCTITARLTPSAPGPRTASLTVSATPGGNATASLSGAGLGPANLTILPATHDFGGVVTGQSAAQTFTVTNNGGVASAAATSTLSGADSGQFSILGDTCGAAIPPAGTCRVTVGFAPTTTGSKVARLNVSASPGGTAMSDLMGSGVAPGNLSINPSSHDYGSIVQGGMTATFAYVVTNTGGADTGMLAVTLPGSDFTRTTDGCNGQVLTSGANCTISVRFNPGTPGPKSVNMQVSATPGGIASANLTGTGLAQASLSILPLSFTYPDTTVNATSVTSFTVSNNGGVASGTLATTLAGMNANQFMITTNTCAGNTLPALGTCSVQVLFAPTSTGSKVGSLNVMGSPGGLAAAGLSGSGISAAALSVTPNPSGWGGVPLGTTADRTLTVSNGGQSMSGTLALSLGGLNAADWSILAPTGTDCVSGNTALLPSATCTVRLRFNPGATGARSAQLNVAASPGGPGSASLTGTGQQAVLGGLPGALAYGTIEVTVASSSQAFVVTNNGDAISGVPTVTSGGSHPGDFSNTNNCGSALMPGASCTVNITFRPTAGGLRSATFTVAASPGGSSMVTVTGTGGYRLTVTKSGGASAVGSVSANSGGISCGSTCFAIYPPSTAVVLTAAEGASQFMTWGGACAGTATTCNITTGSASSTATAQFETRPATTLARQPPPGGSNDTTVTWEFSSSIAGSTFECTVNAAPTSCTSPYSRSFTNGTTNTFQVVAIAPTGARDATPEVGTTTVINTTLPLIAYEMEGNATNSGLLAGYNGVVGGGTTTVSGKFTNALKFTSTNSTTGIDVTGMASFWGSTSSDWTISMWFREDSPGVFSGYLWDFRTSVGWETYHGAGNTNIYTCGGGTPACDNFVNPTFGVWHNIIWEYNSTSYTVGAAMNIYVDNVIVATTNNTTPAVLFDTSMASLSIGNSLANNRASSFYVDRAKIFNETYSASSRCTTVIGGTYNAGTGVCTLP